MVFSLDLAAQTVAVPFSFFCKVCRKIFLRAITLRALPIVWLVLSLNCLLTAVCKLTFGTRPRDAGIIFCGVVVVDGRGKLSHLEVYLVILGRRLCLGSV